MGIFRNKEKNQQKIVMIDIALIQPNTSQPRIEFNEASLKSLADSIAENGIIQPVCVRKKGVLYEIISGERRTRAAKMAGLTEVPCIVMTVDEEQSAILALIENIQRQDLSYFEEAMAIEKLISVYGLTQECAASRLGKAQSTIANKLRLLRFTDSERNLLISGNISERQARSLVRISDDKLRKKALEKVISCKYNIEQTENLVNSMLTEKVTKQRKKKEISSFMIPHPRMVINSINKLIQSIKDYNLPCETSSRKLDGFYEYVIKIPVTNE